MEPPRSAAVPGAAEPTDPRAELPAAPAFGEPWARREGPPRPGVPPSVGDGRRPWQQAELAWPLSIAAGCAGTWLGLVAGVPLVPTVLATAAFAPLYLALLRRGRPGTAAATSVAWMVAIVFTVAGVVLDSSPAAARGALFFSDPERLAAFGLVRGKEAVASRSSQLAAQLLVGALLLLVARPTRGVGTLFGVALVLGAVSGGAADWTARAMEGHDPSSPTDPLAAVLAGFPPGPLLALAGLLLAGTAAADPRRLLPLSDLPRGRRRMLQGGLLLACAALFFEPLYAPAWWSLVGLL